MAARRTRVALVCGTLAPERDGVADYVCRLAAALPAAGVDPVVVAVRPEGTADPDGVTVLDVPGWGVAGVRTAGRVLARAGVDLVHVQFAPSAYGFSPAVGLLPLVTRGLPRVTTLHEYSWWSWPGRVPARVWSALERGGRWDRETLTLVPRSDALVVTNAGHAASVAARTGRTPRVVPLAPNLPDAGGDPAAHRRRVRERLGLGPRTSLLAFVGFVHPVKGVRYLLDAAAALRSEGRDVHVAVAGGFTSLALPEPEARAFRAELEAHAAASGLAGSVTITGYLPAAEVSAVLHAADAVVLPFTAGVGAKSGSLLAAWAHRRPVVATGSDPPDPDVVDGRTAVLVPRVRDGAAVADALRRLLDDPELARRVAAGGAAYAAPRSWAAVAEASAELYDEVLDARSGHRSRVRVGSGVRT